jgi:hypothetical protein
MREKNMLTLSEIARLTTSCDPSIYSDLYKDVYGCRPGNVKFASVEAFDKEFKYLCDELELQLAEDAAREAANFVKFEEYVNDVQNTVGVDLDRAIRIIGDAEGMDEEDFQFYGYGMLEWKLGLKYGAIKKFLGEDFTREGE